MAGPTTARRGERHEADESARPSGPAPKRRGPELPGRLTLILLAVAVALCGGAAVWALYGSSWLRVERVQASGTDILTPREVRDAAAVPMGAPLISVDTDAVEERLRRKLPRIATVDVVRSWPHGIGLKVTERQPVLLIEKGGKFVEVDASGMRFATVDTAPKGVPSLELDADRSPSLRRFGVDRLVREAVRVAGDAPGSLTGEIEAVSVRSYDAISLELRGGRTVVWGSGEKGDTKASALTALMKAAPKAGHFDVSVPTAPASSGS